MEYLACTTLSTGTQTTYIANYEIEGSMKMWNSSSPVANPGLASPSES